MSWSIWLLLGSMCPIFLVNSNLWENPGQIRSNCCTTNHPKPTTNTLEHLFYIPMMSNSILSLSWLVRMEWKAVAVSNRWCAQYFYQVLTFDQILVNCNKKWHQKPWHRCPRAYTRYIFLIVLNNVLSLTIIFDVKGYCVDTLVFLPIMLVRA